jgi:hypothetical protein
MISRLNVRMLLAVQNEVRIVSNKRVNDALHESGSLL